MLKSVNRRLGQRFIHVLFATVAILTAAIVASIAQVPDVPSENQGPEYHVFLFTPAGTEDCGDVCSYSENHVYYLTTAIGYRDGEAGTVVRDENGEQIGYLALP